MIQNAKGSVVKQLRKWIGLVEVVALRENHVLEPHEAGAFVTVLALASDPGDFRERVKGTSIALGLKVVSCNDVEAFAERASKGRLKASIRKLAGELTSSAPVLFDVFCSYPP
jgi:hypothetical protein